MASQRNSHSSGRSAALPRKIGQIDQGQPITLYGTLNEARTIPPTPGPYTITATHAADFVEDLGVTKAGVPMVKVASAPAAGQYAVNVATGVYTFAAADQNLAVVLRYRYRLSASLYTIAMPNLVVFTRRRRPASDHGRFRILFQLRFPRGCRRFPALRRSAVESPTRSCSKRCLSEHGAPWSPSSRATR
jgi:hypothetical protein